MLQLFTKDNDTINYLVNMIYVISISVLNLIETDSSIVCLKLKKKLMMICLQKT